MVLRWVKNKSWFVGFTLFSTFVAQSQGSLTEYKQKYQGSQIVQLKRMEYVTINVVKEEIKVNTHFENQYLLLNSEAVPIFSDEEIDYTSFDKLVNLNAYSYHLDDKKTKIKATNFKTQTSEKSEGVFHDDMKTLSFLYPGLKEGSVRFNSYDLESSEHRFPFGFRFFSYYPLEEAKFVIDHDTSVHLSHYSYNMEGYNVEFKEEIKKNRRIWTWTCIGAPSYRMDSNAPPPSHYLPGVISQISHVSTKQGRKNVLSNVDDLVGWYTEFVQQAMNEQPSEELIYVTNSLFNAEMSELKKVEAIYYWVQDNIKYIAFEEGMEGFVPRMANQILEKRFGDCKDMAVLLFKMMEAAGIEGRRIAWIGTRTIPYNYSDLPTAATDNHMIAYYKGTERGYFLDATMETHSIHFPAYSIQGKEALIYRSRNDYFIEKVPISKAAISTYHLKSTIEIDKRKIYGQNVQVASGYNDWLTKVNLQYLSGKENEKKIEAFGTLGNNSYKVKKATIDVPQDRTKAVVLDYQFEVDNYVTYYDGELFINLILDKDIYKEKQLKATRNSLFEMDFYSDNYYTFELKIPEGMQVKSLPENVNYQTDDVSFKVDYVLSDGYVTATVNTKFEFLYLDKKSFHTWNGFVKAVDGALSNSVVLENKN